MTKKKTCTLLFLIKDDEILLAMKNRGFGAGLYNGVGGKVEPNETIEEALIRECREEIGVTPVHYWQVAEHDFQQNDTIPPWRMYVHVYFCNEWRGQPIESEEMTPKWYKTTAIPYDKMWQDDILWLPKVLTGDKIQGLFTFNEHNNMLTNTVESVAILPNETLDGDSHGTISLLA